VKAVGKTYHKDCLRCMECSTLLDSNRLRDHDGDPLCVKCYGKVSWMFAALGYASNRSTYYSSTVHKEQGMHY